MRTEIEIMMQLIQQLPSGEWIVDDPAFEGQVFDSFGDACAAAAQHANEILQAVDAEMQEEQHRNATPPPAPRPGWMAEDWWLDACAAFGG